jgi:subtilisin family serine protease
MNPVAQRAPEPPRPQATGRTLVYLRSGVDADRAVNRLTNSTGIRTLDVREFGTNASQLRSAQDGGAAIVLPRFKVAILPATSEDGAMRAALVDAEEVQRVRPEFYMYAIGAGGPPYADNDDFAWGLIATEVPQTAFTGRGIRVAVLDTGLDLHHPDFAGRNVVANSFVGGTAQDVQGHGTHTAGTIAGPAASAIGSRRYGVAPDIDLYVGKVLNDNGSGREGDIISGMNWAIDQKCVAISMSLGRATSPDEAPDPLYEDIGTAALAENCLIIAAAGNESARDYNYIAPVGAPANSRTIMAVAAVDHKLNVAPFSCGGINANGGAVDISGPGVGVYSSFPRPDLSKPLRGTSMACPHVSGIAALLAQSDQSLRGQKLWDALAGTARPLGIARDFGAGLARIGAIQAGA